MTFRYLSDGRRTTTWQPPDPEPPISKDTADGLGVDLSPLDTAVGKAWDTLREFEDDLLTYEQREQAHAGREQQRSNALAQKYGMRR